MGLAGKLIYWWVVSCRTRGRSSAYAFTTYMIWLRHSSLGISQAKSVAPQLSVNI